MPRHDFSQIAAKFDEAIREDGQPVTLWRPGRTVAGGTPIESNPASAGTTTALILQGGDAAQQATLAGLDPNQSAVAYFYSGMTATITAGMYLQDAGGLWWRVHSKPDIQRGGAAGIALGVSALLALQSQKPAGIP